MITEFLIKTALAQEPLVPPCPIDPKTHECNVALYTMNDFLQLIINVIEFAIKFLAFPLVVLFFLIGGFLLLTSGGSPNRIEQGKKAITGAIIGLVIVLTSVVVINTILTVFTNCNVDFTKVGIVDVTTCLR